MANEKWEERVKRAQQMAAERLGVDVSVMQPPREPSAGGAAAAEAEPAAAVEPARAATTQAAAPEPATATTAAEAAPATDAAAQRIAQAKERAAAKRSSTNGGGATATQAAPAARPAAPAARPAAAPAEEAAPAEVGEEGINRREFLSYAWGAALGVLTLEAGAATYFFMYPRFRAGQFGGKFTIGAASSLPASDAAPAGNTTGKFWLVDTEEGPKALYMVCTHLGCLYKWEPANFRFECPCHGSKFSHDGYYIEGPAPRSLDQFVIEVVQNDQVVSTTELVDEAIVPPALPGPDAQLVVDTGSRIIGRPSSISPARAEV